MQQASTGQLASVVGFWRGAVVGCKRRELRSRLAVHSVGIYTEASGRLCQFPEPELGQASLIPMGRRH